MLMGMQTSQFIAHVTNTRDHPGHQVTPDDALRAYLDVQRIARDLEQLIASSNSITAPEAILFIHAAEDAHRAAAHTQLLAPDAARRTLAHELSPSTLNAISDIHEDSTAFIVGTCPLPSPPAVVLSGRPTFKDTTELISNTIHIGYFEARERVRNIDRLLPHTDIHGIRTPARYPRLAEELATGKADPKELANAARKLERLTPQIHQQPNPGQVTAAIEEQVAESIRHQDPRSTNKLFTRLESDLELGNAEPTDEVLRSKAGMFYRGVIGGLAEFLLRTMPSDTDILLNMCAQTDNPRTKAGDRDGLLQQSKSANASNDPLTAVAFPDFLVDPSTGKPLTDPATIAALSLDGTSAGLEPERTEKGVRSSGPTPEEMNSTGFGTDGLTPPQRHLQGLMNLVKTVGRTNTGKKSTGLPSPKTIVIATLAELEGRAKTHGLTSRGQNLTAAELRQNLCNGGVLPMILDGKSRILDLGTEKRFFPNYMREAILALYGGCIVPNCTVPPEHCEIHHVVPVNKGGKTEIGSGLPNCGNHHHGTHLGIYTYVRDKDGLFSVILPKFMDPEQKPRRNTYWKNKPEDPHLF